MKRFILGLGTMAVTFGLMTSPIMAAVVHGHAPAHGPAHVAPAHGHAGPAHHNYGGLHHGAGGYMHRDFRDWGHHYYNAHYRCDWYFYPAANCYYYWYAPWDCFLPVSYIAIYPPV